MGVTVAEDAKRAHHIVNVHPVQDVRDLVTMGAMDLVVMDVKGNAMDAPEHVMGDVRESVKEHVQAGVLQDVQINAKANVLKAVMGSAEMVANHRAAVYVTLHVLDVPGRVQAHAILYVQAHVLLLVVMDVEMIVHLDVEVGVPEDVKETALQDAEEHVLEHAVMDVRIHAAEHAHWHVHLDVPILVWEHVQGSALVLIPQQYYK